MKTAPGRQVKNTGSDGAGNGKTAQTVVGKFAGNLRQIENGPTKTLWAFRMIGMLALLVSAAIMLKFSWFKWPDPLIDFGRELYVPWRIVEGDVLYRDIFYFNGPFSPYWNALCFFLFGTSLKTVVWINLIILATVIALNYGLLRYSASAFSAWLACLVFILLFAFNQFAYVGNYNYVCPYSHEITHGILFSLGGLFIAARYTRTHNIYLLAISGFLLGLAFLTKPEVFLAAAIAMAAHITIHLWLMESGKKFAFTSCAAALVGFAVPPVFFFILLTSSMSGAEARTGVLGAWNYIFDPRLRGLLFYQSLMGIDQPVGNLSRMAASFFSYTGVFAMGAGVSYAVKGKRNIRIACAILLILLIIFTLGFWQSLPFRDAGRSLPLILLIILTAMAWKIVKEKDDRYIAAFSYALFSLILLGKIFLHVRFWHYGFALAMPATMIFVVMLAEWIPKWIRSKGKDPFLFVVTAVFVIAVIAIGHIQVSMNILSQKTVPVGQGEDFFYADIRGKAVNQAMEWLNDNKPSKESSLAVFPEGAMLNYLMRMRNPTPIVNLMPAEWLMFGQERILQSIQRAPPDLIALVHKDTSEYGYQFFGNDYGSSVAEWIVARYSPGYLIGYPPLQDHRFGIGLLERNH